MAFWTTMVIYPASRANSRKAWKLPGQGASSKASRPWGLTHYGEIGLQVLTGGLWLDWIRAMKETRSRHGFC